MGFYECLFFWHRSTIVPNHNNVFPFLEKRGLPHPQNPISTNCRLWKGLRIPAHRPWARFLSRCSPARRHGKKKFHCKESNNRCRKLSPSRLKLEYQFPFCLLKRKQFFLWWMSFFYSRSLSSVDLLEQPKWLLTIQQQCRYGTVALIHLPLCTNNLFQ